MQGILAYGVQALAQLLLTLLLLLLCAALRFDI